MAHDDPRLQITQTRSSLEGVESGRYSPGGRRRRLQLQVWRQFIFGLAAGVAMLGLLPPA